MTDLFTRNGSIHTGPHLTDSKGAFITQPKKCSRCGGAGGADKWKHTGWTCFECGGARTVGTEIIRLFTAEKLTKLNVTAAKRLAAQATKAQVKADEGKARFAARKDAFFAKHGELIAAAEPFVAQSPFVADIVRKAHQDALLSDVQLHALAVTIQKIAAQDALNSRSQHVGTVGERIEAQVTVERIASFPRPSFSGHGQETVWVITMRDADGNLLISKSPRFHAEKGETFTVKGTVKEHTEFRDEKQTLLQRITVKEVAA